MKKVILFLTIFFLGITNVSANYMGLGDIEISKDRTNYLITGMSLSRATLQDKQKFVFTEKNVVNYINNIESFLTPYYSNVFYDGSMDDNGGLKGKASLIPGELLSSRVLVAGGSSGSCKLVNHEIDCSSRDNPSDWNWAQQTNPTYLEEAYPIMLDSLVSITRPDIYEPVSFKKSSKSFSNSIIENGSLDSEGRWISNTPIKVYESEYKSGNVELLVREVNPFGLANIYFSRNGYSYIEQQYTKSVYETLTNEQITEKCKNDFEIYSKMCESSYKLNNNKKYVGNLETVPIDKTNNVIHGVWFTIFKGSDQNKKIYNAYQTYGTQSFGAIYEFEIPIEVIPDDNNVSEETPKKLTGIQDNNAKIFIDNQEISISNKKDYDLGRIYVSLEDICKNIDTCKIEQATDKENKNFYRITRKILNTEVEFSLIHYPETKTFETTIYKNNENLNFDIISPATGYIDAESKIIDGVLYVPIRFLLEGLGANIKYINGKSEIYPEEVHITFEDTLEMKIDSETLTQSKEDKNKYTTKVSENYINFGSNLQGTKSFYAFQLEKSNAQITKSNNTKYENKIIFPTNDIYQYLLISKTNYNGSEFMAYQIFDIEYKN